MNESFDIQYFAKITSFKNLINSTHVEFNEYETYEKREFLNRCVVAGSNGPIILSVPLTDGRNQKKILKDVRIANEEKWQKRHWRTILSCYNPSPWFFHFSDEMAALFDRRFEFLLDWNLACLDTVYACLGLPANYCLSGSTVLKKSPGSLSSFTGRYVQVFEDKIGFQPDLSIIDLLFCTGPIKTLDFIRQ